MNKFLSELGAAFDWIWVTPEEARQLLRERDLIVKIRDAQGAYEKAA